MKMDALAPKLKLITLLSLAILVIVLILQNTHAVATRMLFVTVSMPLAALLAMVLLVGFACGVLAALIVSKRSK